MTPAAEQALFVALADRMLELLRRAALDLADDGATDPVIQRHIANVCNHAGELLHDEADA